MGHHDVKERTSALWGFILAMTVGLMILASPVAANPPEEPLDRKRPNFVFILADDLGYGDVQSFHSAGKIKTPYLDRLAAEGMKFTDAHAGSAVCTPTRYGILTGRYAWRSRLERGVLGGYSPPLIRHDQMTVASLLKSCGYKTACVGKWHLGLNWATHEQTEFTDAIDPPATASTRVDYSQPFADGPIDLGFDHFFGISASLDMPPYVFLIDDRAEVIPTAERTYIRKGPAAPDFEAIDVLPRLVEESLRFLGERSADQEPFFLYLALTSPHTPIVPSKEFAGRSGLSAYADFTMQTDAAIGRVAQALDQSGLAENTLLVVTSDNGCSPQADFKQLNRLGHNPSGPFRGAKADIYEGGHRVPMVARWPGKIRPGSAYHETVCLTDFMATCADILGARLPGDAAVDSYSLLPAMLDAGNGPIREATVHHSIDGSFAIRKGQWKLALCAGSGGWSFPRPGNDEQAGLPPIQLYDLQDDPAESRNKAADHPEIVDSLTLLLQKYVREGRSTPGPSQANDRPIPVPGITFTDND